MFLNNKMEGKTSGLNPILLSVPAAAALVASYVTCDDSSAEVEVAVAVFPVGCTGSTPVLETISVFLEVGIKISTQNYFCF